MKLYIPQLVKRVRVLVKEIKVLELVKENQELKSDQEALLEEIDENRYAKGKLEFVMSDFEKFVRGEGSACTYCRKIKDCHTSYKFRVDRCVSFDYTRRPLKELTPEE